MNSLAEYQRRLADRRALSEREQKLFRRIGNARLFTGIVGVILAFFVFGETFVAPWWLAVPVTVLGVLVGVHARVVERLERAKRAVAFYERGLERLEDRWIGKGEMGERFHDPAHVYAEDLDLFGKGSLFELLCIARTRAGEDTLAGWLLGPASREEAAGRQEAIAELRPRLDLREDLAVLGASVRSEADPDGVARWARAPIVSFPAGARFIAAILAAAVLVTFGLYMARFATRSPFLVALLTELAYGFFLGTRTLRVAGAVNSPARDLALFATLLERIEKEPCDAPLVRDLKSKLAGRRPGGLRRDKTPAPPGGDAGLAAQHSVCPHRHGPAVERANRHVDRTMAEDFRGAYRGVGCRHRGV